MYSKLSSLIVAIVYLFSGASASAAMSIHSTKLSIDGQAGFLKTSDLIKGQKKSSKTFNATCAEVHELPGTLICAFKSTLVMNESLLRIGFYTGTATGFPRGTVISNNDRTLIQFKKRIAGHTVTLEDSRSFFSEANNSSNISRLLTPYETDFRLSIVESQRLSSAQSKFSVIAFPVESSDVKTVLRHEINHAKWYLDSKYRSAVTSFWQNTVSVSDKLAIERVLAETYNVNNPDIIIDEFQAYLMEGDISGNPLRSMIHKYKAALIAMIRAYGSEPITQ